MSMEAVNSNSGGSPLTGLGLVAGAGAGAAAGYFRQPYLKDGVPTDTFIKNLSRNLSDRLPEEHTKTYNQALETLQKIDQVADKDQLKDFIKASTKDEAAAKAGIASFDKLGFEKVKEAIKQSAQAIKDSTEDFYKAFFEHSWDSKNKKFHFNKDLITEDAFKAVKKAAKSIQGRYMGIYAAVGAAVLGTLGHLVGSAAQGARAAAMPPEAYQMAEEPQAQAAPEQYQIAHEPQMAQNPQATQSPQAPVQEQMPQETQTAQVQEPAQQPQRVPEQA